ncbi:multidrug effflux MFS transporter [Ramlibacter rhizophilus]|uniref:Bcr/CflA family efflux transporter n=1 Tax=Ramlibacter rhizophilus TaxID=1781167 RepID=A0A4Z0BQH0_9BURK|nr:multidrug effflux MFS transporter [Ramlibacter rhizophilus]TFZ01022.1 Bcr/CflA family efflux MFS transporter [Ramlibacter rhizophilus]
MNQDCVAVRRHSPWLTVNLIAQFAFGLVAMTICLPSMQDWPRLFAASQASVQLTFSVYVIAYGVMQLVYGALSDRLGRKPVLMAGLVVAIVASVLATMAPTIAWLIAARGLQGAGAAACMVVGRALVQDLFDAHERTRTTAFIGMTMGLCPPAATLLGGQLHVHVGWAANFWFMAMLGLALLFAAWKGLPSPARRPAGEDRGSWRDSVAGYARLARVPAFLAYVAILAGSTATFYTFLAGAPIVLGGYGVGPKEIGWYLMSIPIAYMLGNWLTTRLVSRLGDRRLMNAGQALALLGLLLTLAVGIAGWRSPWALALPLMVLGVGHGLLVPPALVGTVGLLPALAGSAAAVTGLMQQLFGALGGYLVGLVPHEGSVNLVLLMIGWAVVGIGAQGVLFGKARR